MFPASSTSVTSPSGEVFGIRPRKSDHTGPSRRRTGPQAPRGRRSVRHVLRVGSGRHHVGGCGRSDTSSHSHSRPLPTEQRLERGSGHTAPRGLHISSPTYMRLLKAALLFLSSTTSVTALRQFRFHRLISTTGRRAMSGTVLSTAASADSGIPTSTSRSPPNPHAFSLQQTMLRITNPEDSLAFYTTILGFKLLHKYEFPQWKFNLYFLGVPPLEEAPWPEPGTVESEARLWTCKFSTLELTYNYDAEELNNGNVEPFRGFGHVAVMTPDVYAACADLEAKGVKFQKKPDEGRMKGLAFALDPSGYWIEIITRSAQSIVPNSVPFTLAQTMVRVKDPAKSLRFYRDLLGMTLLRESHYSDFSLYFLAHLPEGTEHPAKDSPEAAEFIRCMYPQVIELTHNHGTESNADFSYHNGNDNDKGQKRGFGHVGFLTKDLEAACSFLQSEGATFKKLPSEGTMRGLAFVYDPDGYWVELIQAGGLSMIK